MVELVNEAPNVGTCLGAGTVLYFFGLTGIIL